MKRSIYLRLALPAAFLIVVTAGCKRENVEEKFYGQSSAARQYFSNNVYPILQNKCFSCHNYHNSSSTRYDTYPKAEAIVKEMANRISASHGSIMPPLSSAPLTGGEKEIFNKFFSLVQGNQTKDYSASISWTAYKFPDFSNRAAVTGTFDNTYIQYKNKNKNLGDIWEYLKEAEITINSNSVNINNDSTKNFNLRNYFFSFFTPVIHCKVLDVDHLTKKAFVKITMNGISNKVEFTITEQGEDLVFAGSIGNLNNFNSQAALDSLQKACGVYHGNKVWRDIDLKAEIKNYKNFTR